jgi:hypothetical protein
MSRTRIALVLPVAALSLSILACNMPGLAAQAAATTIEEQVEIARRVDQALAAVEDAAPPEAQVESSDAPQEAANPAAEPTIVPELTATPTPVPTLVETGCTDRVEFVADVTVEDGADFDPGEHFTKTWRLRNAGSCTWTSSYDLVFSHGDAMSGPAAKALPGVVNPGQTMDLSVNLIAPNTEGGYQGYWLLRSADGMLFGLGASADVAFWVEIEVIDPDAGPALILPLIPMQPFFALYTSNGTGQVLPDGFCFDLDEGAITSCGNPNSDFQYDASITFEGFPPTMEVHTVVDPGHSALFGAHGTEVPTGAECQAQALTASDREISHGIYCYRTSGGKYGYLRVTSLGTTSVTFDWATYNSP